ncbi:MAG: 2-oxoglutarate dehydrogenase E1 component [Bacteroidetes bacterium]|nr:2-oxoglutarate dehydrogenase E1 component [Bacteroidota bacterium]
MDANSYLSNIDIKEIEELYRIYKNKPDSIDYGWQKFFEGFDFSKADFSGNESEAYPSEFKVINLINAYRERGHYFTKTNPVRTRRKYSPTLDIENFELTSEDLEKEFKAGNKIGIGTAKLKDIIAHLQTTYCHTLGVEYRYIRTPEISDWLRSRMESTKNQPDFSKDEKMQILQKLSEAVLFEKFIHKKFPGQKRFSLEGAESSIPALNALVEKGSQLGVKEFVIGMPHRGRLNVLANILHKSSKDIFSEFEGKEYDDDTIMGDVKYHLGFTSHTITKSGENVKLTLSPNPSHLEAVNPVVEGIVRARIDLDYEGDNSKIVPILMHGDASLAGQGIVYEVLQMSELAGYKTGGTIHLVINNQIGFTTNYLDARSSNYCTDIAKIIQSPIFHVNGDDVEEVVYAMQFAMEYRQKFHKDVFIDLLCYRKYGHNEGDEPRFTQPILYKIIEKHPNPREIYIEQLLEKGVIQASEAKEIEKKINDLLEKNLLQSKDIEKTRITSFLENEWKAILKAKPADFESSPSTAVDRDALLKVANAICYLPEEIPFFTKLHKLYDDRKQMLLGEGKLDWAMGELLAYGSLLEEGHLVRLSGQDVGRGTFSHRHAELTIDNSDDKYIPLNHLSEKQAKFEIYNSLLSEYGVLGFEYGYALASPDTLTIWEAQFGDFFNGAQIIIDQFISSAEDKWKVMNDLVMLLPHGFEGQGPEHSSARIERFLTLCADNNMQIANCSTPANFFHILRRQLARKFRKPLIIFTPKSLLRNTRCVSKIEDFTLGGFKEIIDDAAADPAKVDRVVFCSGKIYYDLMNEQELNSKGNIAIVRVEQLYPVVHKQWKAIQQKYKNAKHWLWVQEEPENMGAWSFIRQQINYIPLILFAARSASGSPATGSSKVHKSGQQKIIEKSMGKCICEWAMTGCDMHCVEKE